MDATATDAPEAGTDTPDTGAAEVGVADVGSTTLDTGATDSATTDVVASEIGTVDTGTTDAGVPFDAGATSVCVPGLLECVGATLRTCRADGVAYEVTPCASGVCGAEITADMRTVPVGWNFNGDAAYNPLEQLGILTRVALRQVGSIVYARPLAADAFEVSFQFRMGGGDGADGMGFFLQSNGPTAVGGGGGGLGMAGLTGFGVELDTASNGACMDGNANHVAVDSLTPCSSGNGTPTSLLANGTLPISLRDGAWHTCTIAVAAGQVTVRLPGATVIDRFAVPGLATAGPQFFGFAGGTGLDADRHEVRNITIRFPTARCL